MSNGVLLFPNMVDADPAFAEVSAFGGNWRPAMPLTNVLQPRFAERARSVNATKGDCWGVIDLGTVRAIRGFALIGHNLSLSAKVVLTVSNDRHGDDIGPVLSGPHRIEVFPQIYPIGSSEFEDEHFFHGREVEENTDKVPVPVLKIFKERVIGRYWKLAIDDTDNPDGYVEISRVYLASGFQPTVNWQLGSALAVQDRTTVFETRSGVEYFDVRPRRREAIVQLANIPTDEAMAKLFDTIQRGGISDQVVFSWDPGNPFHLQRWTFPGRLTRLSPLRAARAGLFEIAFNIREVIG
ncbi:MAG: hypothetical protein NXI16_09245 [Alphaproteobacteria bacterium]|nr:hypothetical protein [Alphaproteobacteria bacterium]